MYASRTNSRPSTAQNLQSYGLISIELQHVTERRATERQRDRISAALQLPGHLSMVRQWLGNSMIRFGGRIAGDAPSTPRAGHKMRPRPGSS